MDASVADIGGKLRVEHVLRGSVRRVGDRIRVVAVLVETGTGYEKWSRTFERPAASMARLPGDIAGAAAGAVGLALVGDPGVRGSRVGTRSPTAYDHYMLGQQRFSERTAFALTEAQRYFQQAIEADPGFAAAYAALADVHVAEFYFANRQLSETLDLMLPLVDEALEIDPAFGFAHALLGWAELERGDFAEARVDLAKAIELSPNDAKARMWLGGALFADARPREALDELERALELDPLNFILHIRHALVLDALGRHDAAVEAATRAVTLAPRHPNPRWTLALIATSRGDLQQAIGHYEAALALDPARSDLRIQLATLLLDVGRATDARRQLSDASRLAQSSHAFLTAQAYSALLAGDQAELASIAESLASIDPRNRYLMMDAANFMALAGEHAKAIELFDRARAENPDSILYDLWMIRWGLETAPSCLGWSYAATGRIGERQQLTARVDRFLVDAQQRGVRYWGLAYQRATLAALEGDTIECAGATRGGGGGGLAPRLVGPHGSRAREPAYARPSSTCCSTDCRDLRGDGTVWSLPAAPPGRSRVPPRTADRARTGYRSPRSPCGCRGSARPALNGLPTTLQACSSIPPWAGTLSGTFTMSRVAATSCGVVHGCITRRSCSSPVVAVNS